MVVFSEDKIIFQAGRKTFDVSSTQDGGRFRFLVVERHRGRMHKAFFSFREMLWVCEWMVKASNFKGLFWRKRTEKWREVTIAKEENRSGSFLRVVVKAGGSSGVICVPEIVANHFVAEKMHRFAAERNPESKKPGKSYKEAAEMPSWPGEDLNSRSTTKQSGVDFEVDVDSCKGSSDFLSRCLVGRVGDLDCPIPSRESLQNWVDRRWKTTGGVRVVDMNGKFLLFEFPSKEAQ